MNVASLNLCNELYELSGWDDTFFISQLQFSNDTITKSRVVVDRENGSCSSHNHKPYPAYDLGYLLRKLPGKRIKLRNYSNGLWKCQYSYDEGSRTHDIVTDAATPEDAGCKLAIELFKQGILKKEQQ